MSATIRRNHRRGMLGNTTNCQELRTEECAHCELPIAPDDTDWRTWSELGTVTDIGRPLIVMIRMHESCFQEARGS